MRENLEALVRLGGATPIEHYRLATLYLEAGRVEEAAARFRQAVEHEEALLDYGITRQQIAQARRVISQVPLTAGPRRAPSPRPPRTQTAPCPVRPPAPSPPRAAPPPPERTQVHPACTLREVALEALDRSATRVRVVDLARFRLALDAHRVSLAERFDDLLCLRAMTGVDEYAYQVATVRRVLKAFRGRALLGDEVGLGKTVEAGMALKEFLLRGMVRTVLILVPRP